MARWAAFLCVVCLALPVTVAAGPPDASVRAEALHRSAVAQTKRGRYRSAAKTWTKAMALDPQWKYAVNLSSTQHHVGRHADAWHNAHEALRLGAPDRVRDHLHRIIGEVTAELGRTRALVAVSATPGNARVSLDRRQLPLHGAWVRPGEYDMRVELDGFETYSGRVTCTAGDTIRLRVTLTATRPPPMLVDPEAESPSSVADGTIDDTEPLLQTDRSYRDWGLGTLISGLVVTGVGAGLLGWAQSESEGLTGLDGQYSSYSAYRAEYDRRSDAARAGHGAGIALTTIGATTALTGAVLLIIDSQRETEGTIQVSPWLGGDGGGATALVRF